jgi:heptosyltransferase II
MADQMSTSNQRILIVSPSWVGDMVMSQTLYSLLKSQDDSVQIDVMAPAASKPLVSRMPDVSQSVLFDVDHGEIRIGYRRRFARALRANRYDRAIVLPNSLKSALVPYFARIPQRTGYLGELRYGLLNDIRRLDKVQSPRMIDRFMRLGMQPGETLPEHQQPALSVDEENQFECVSRLQLDTSVPILGLCPGAEFGDAKRWPEAHFASLASAAVKAGMQVWLFGSARDRVLAAEVVSQIDRRQQVNCHNLAGKTTLLDAIDLLKLCHHVVTNDSGLMHIASAVGCHTVALYGSTSPDFTPPLSDRAEIIRSTIECSPCFSRECPLNHKNCLNELLPSTVIPLLDLPA